MTTLIIHNNVSSDGYLLPLEPSSSTESLGTYRNAREYYNIPPQNMVGEYETTVRKHFDQARNVNHYLLIYDRESFELRVL
ncbi:Polyribonucleotide nucleotidyltransferase [Bienertia sinuspersici]